MIGIPIDQLQVLRVPHGIGVPSEGNLGSEMEINFVCLFEIMKSIAYTTPLQA